MVAQLRQHQIDAVAKMHNGCVLWGGVGTGKSMTAMAYYMEKEFPRDIYVFTTARKRDSLDWNQEAARYGIGRSADATVGGVLTVDSWNNIGKYVHVKDAFIICDEQRLVGSGVWVKHFLKMAQKNHWILLSATPGDVWMDYAAIFVANGWYKNRSEFRQDHVIYSHYGGYPKIDRYVGTERLRALRDRVLVEMPMLRETTRHLRFVDVEHDEAAIHAVVKKRWHVYEDRPLKDIGELFRVMRQVTNSDEDRLDKMESLVKETPKLIIFYNFDYELYAIRSRLELMRETEDFAVAEWNGHLHEPIPVGSGRWVYLVQYAAGSEAWNCVETDSILFYSLPYSYKQFEQCQGRIDRLNTQFTDLYYYVLFSKAPIDRLIWSKLEVKKSFQETRQNVRF